MRKLLALLCITVLISFNNTPDELSAKDRKFALDYLKETSERLQKDVKGLSVNQLNWKATDSSWSVAYCVEHIAIAEKTLFEWAMTSFKESADPKRRSDIKQTDESIIKIITDRSFKAKAPEGFRPSGQFGSPAETLNAYLERRANTIKFFTDTKEDLRNHFIAHPFLGTIDTYQMLMFQIGHSVRHTMQIEEVLANPAFPKN